MKEARTHGGCGSRQPPAKVGMGRWLGLEFLRDDEGRERRPLEFNPGDEGDSTESIGGGRYPLATNGRASTPRLGPAAQGGAVRWAGYQPATASG